MRALFRTSLLLALAAVFGAGCGSSTQLGEDASTNGEPDGSVSSPDASSNVPPDAGTTGTPDSGVDAGAGVDSGPLIPPPVPQVVDLGGTELLTPKVQLVGYASDTFLTSVDAMITEYGMTTNEWATQVGEYGIGAFTKLPTISMSGTPPASFDDNTGTVTPFEKMIAMNVSGANPAWAPADGNTMYVFLLPLGTDINSGGNCCTGFLGYHYEAPLTTGSAPYAVVCHCAAQTGDPITPLQYVTTTVNHEMVETATDPYPNSNPAYYQTDNADLVWTDATGGEIADMCEYNTDSNYLPPGSTYMIQRTWSNAAATAGTNPCIPVPASGPYFNAYAIYSDTITVSGATTTGVKIAKGQSRTIKVLLQSPGGSAPWNVQAWDMNNYLGNTANTTVTLDKASGSDGTVLNLTIMVSTYDATYGAAGVVLESSLNGQDNLTMFTVGN
jgi:hypothetical protein